MTKRIILLFGLFVCAGVVHADPLLQDADPEAGKQAAGACAACHGPQGNMESPQFPKLAGQGAPYIYEQLKLFKSGERENAIMAGQAAGLDEQAMKNIAAYFASQQTKPGAADKNIAPAGAHLYHGGESDKGIPACSGCHGPSGLGNPAARFPRLSGQSAGYIATQLTAYRDGSRAGYHNAKIMAGVASRLSDTEIKALASYVAGLGPAGKSADNSKGALMQNVAGPAAGAAGSGTADGGQTPADDNARTQAADSGDNGTQDTADASAGGGTTPDSGPKDSPPETGSGNSPAAPQDAKQGAAAADQATTTDTGSTPGGSDNSGARAGSDNKTVPGDKTGETKAPGASGPSASDAKSTRQSAAGGGDVDTSKAAADAPGNAQPGQPSADAGTDSKQ